MDRNPSKNTTEESRNRGTDHFFIFETLLIFGLKNEKQKKFDPLTKANKFKSQNIKNQRVAKKFATAGSRTRDSSLGSLNANRYTTDASHPVHECFAYTDFSYWDLMRRPYQSSHDANGFSAVEQQIFDPVWLSVCGSAAAHTHSHSLSHTRHMGHTTTETRLCLGCNLHRQPPSRLIEQKSGHKGIFCFIDGTVRPINKPQDLQNANYSGKNRTHALKYQMICTPDGIMQHIGGPWPGSRHDQWCLHDSGIMDWVLGHGVSDEGVPWCTYADAGYSELSGLIRPWPDGNLDMAHQAYNTTMASSRICVEWEFGHIVQHWAALQMRVQQKLLDGSRPGQQYFVAALLTNCLNCLQPNKTSKYFSVEPPALEEYIAGLMQ